MNVAGLRGASCAKRNAVAAVLTGACFLLVFGHPRETRASRFLVPYATPTACPVTEPNGYLPPIGEHVFGRGPGGHGNETLWTNLWTWGERQIVVPDSHVQADGSLGGLKWPWWRGVPGVLEIEGRRLDAPAPPLRAEVPEGYGERGFQPSGLIFPTTGCWEVSGQVASTRLTFVVLVVREQGIGTPDKSGAAGAPLAAGATPTMRSP